MAPRFSITVEPERSIVRIWMAGFFLPEDVARFAAEWHVAQKRLHCGPNEHLTLVDIREAAVQSQEAVAAFQRMLQTPGVYSKRLAIVTNKSLARSQIKRAAAGRTGMAYFDDIDAAEAWVLSVEAQAA